MTERNDICTSKSLDSEKGMTSAQIKRLALNRSTNSSSVVTDTAGKKTWCAAGAKGNFLF